jgi:hypothetical protein
MRISDSDSESDSESDADFELGLGLGALIDSHVALGLASSGVEGS